jgi:ribonucleoside-diphosphate reductase alpha chain
MRYGPQVPECRQVAEEKHWQPGESFTDAMTRIAHALADDAAHERAIYEILVDHRFLPAGRVQAAAGSFRTVTAFNCFVSGTLPDSMSGIMDRVKEAALTMKMGGGIGYDFSTIRPRGDLIKTLGSKASGAVSFMTPFDATCGTVASAGDRRGAQMGVLRVDHPDIRAFIKAKMNDHNLTNFNVSIGVTDAFMDAVETDGDFDLVFEGAVYETLRARDLWEEIMAATWDYAEPGVIFIDRVNQMNNLWYCESIAATNPCGEQPLPPYGACLLGSFNWIKYVRSVALSPYFDVEQLREDVHVMVRAMDNVIDRTVYPLPEQEAEASAKRRMGLGATGVANAGEVMGMPYASPDYLDWCDGVMQVFVNECYRASANLAREKGAFPLYDKDRYMEGAFIQKLEGETLDLIKVHGIRNSHLTSIAPTGSISFAADNISSALEPPFMLDMSRTVKEWDGNRVVKLQDYAYANCGVAGRTANELSPKEHVAVLTTFQRWVDSACSKTCNIGDDVTFEEFKDVYLEAYRLGAKGCTTFRAAGKRYGIMNAVEEPTQEAEAEGAACYINPETGHRSCD